MLKRFPQSSRRCQKLTKPCQKIRTCVTLRGRFSTAPSHQMSESMLACSGQTLLMIWLEKSKMYIAIVVVILDPLSFCLYSDDRQVKSFLYDAILLQLRSFAPFFQPKLAVTYFEHLLRSFIRFSSECEIRGYYFDIWQSLWRKWHQLGL